MILLFLINFLLPMTSYCLLTQPLVSDVWSFLKIFGGFHLEVNYFSSFLYLRIVCFSFSLCMKFSISFLFLSLKFWIGYTHFLPTSPTLALGHCFHSFKFKDEMLFNKNDNLFNQRLRDNKASNKKSLSSIGITKDIINVKGGYLVKLDFRKIKEVLTSSS